ncbi:MAG: 50S ribosomal protein L20 [Alphaproteobacteria bacterium]|nr:50S ribosomal protein L20 [Alphaproteobacteria bacterium]
MSRVTSGPATASRHKKVLKKAKGYYGARHRQFRTAVQAVEKAGQYAYRDRRAKKRNFRSLWIQRINAGAREHGMTYSVFMNGLTKAGIEVDRKVLSDIAIREPEAFKALVEQARAALA